MVALFLVAVSVGLDNLGAAAAIGVSGVDRALRIRVALVFGVFEAAMPLIGVLIGRVVSGEIGSAAKPAGGVLLGIVGCYVILTELLGHQEAVVGRDMSVVRLIILAAALSVDNLVVGFAIGTIHVNLAVAAATIAVVSVALSLLGLELGSRLGRRFAGRSELVGGIILVAVGVAIGTGLL